MYSDHEQTEAFRPGLQGPYALEITNGSDPAPVDYSFMDNLGITGWVTASGRGAVSGTASGVPSGYAVTVGLSNSAAQYWASADPSSGAFGISGILPGTYTETLYANELAVGSQSVTISAGQTTPADIQASYNFLTPIWSIGTWDGTPNEFLNEPALHTEHPSDSRLTPWNNVSFVIGSNADSDWPAVQWKNVNNDNQIVFTLTADQAAVANTLRIGITDAFAGGRPYIVVNAGQPYAWTSALPSPSSQPNSRSITLGTYRGNNVTFTYNIPQSKLVAGTNTIDIIVNSGSGSSGYLSAAIVYDAIDLVPTSGGAGPSVARRPNAPTSSPAASTALAVSPDVARILSPGEQLPASPALSDGSVTTAAILTTPWQPDSSPNLLADHMDIGSQGYWWHRSGRLSGQVSAQVAVAHDLCTRVLDEAAQVDSGSAG
jgi:rhamnogalacturonan endolyase